MPKVTNDIHAVEWMLRGVKELKMSIGDSLILNGDLLGSRGPIGNEVTRIYYQVKFGQAKVTDLESYIGKFTKEKVSIPENLVFDSIHSGTFLVAIGQKYPEFQEILDNETLENLEILRRIARTIERQGGVLYYLPGNGEIMHQDFIIDDGIDIEKTVPIEERFFNRCAEKGVFHDLGVEYINYPKIINEDTLLLPIDYIELWIDDKAEPIFEPEMVKRAIVHYPPYDEILLSVFRKTIGYQENAVGLERMKAVAEILSQCEDLQEVICGHIHRGVNDEKEVKQLPLSIWFNTYHYRTIWNRPGNIFTLDPL